MKKLMTALAVCLAAGFAVATGGGVVSSNVVGYRKESSVDGAWIQSIQFTTVGGDPQAATSISNVLVNATVATGDQLWIFHADIGDYFQYEMGGDKQWHQILAPIIGGDGNPGDGSAYDIQCKPGDSFLLVSGNTLTFAGQVPSITSYVHHFNGVDGAYFVGSAIPRDATVASFDWTSSLATGDQLWIFHADIGDYFQYEWGGDHQWHQILAPIIGGDGNPGDGSTLPDSTSLKRGFLLITGTTALTENL